MLSIIVPVYNVEKYIRRCVYSILKQTYKNLEVILVDDGSTDNSGGLCDKLEKEDNRVKVIHKENGGLSSARNAGIAIAEGDYLGFVDSDDYIEPDMYQTLYNAIINTGKDIACCGRIVDVLGEYSNEEFTLDRETIFSKKDAIGEILFLETIDVSACDKLYKRKLFKKIRYPMGKISEDAAVIFELLELSNGIVHVGRPLYHYVFRNNSITKTKYNEKKYDVIDNLNSTKHFIEKKYPIFMSNCHIYCCICSAALLLDMWKETGAKKVYPEHYKEYRSMFNNGFYDAISSNRINKKMKARLIAIKTHTLILFFMAKGIYTLFRKRNFKKV